MNALKTFAIVLLGVVLWGVAWNLGGLASMALWPQAFPDPDRIDHPGVLIGYVGYSSVLSVAVGALAMRLSGAARTVMILAGVQLAIGVAVQTAYGSVFPLWYHLVFLGAVVPATVLGGHLARRAAPAGAA